MKSITTKISAVALASVLTLGCAGVLSACGSDATETNTNDNTVVENTNANDNANDNTNDNVNDNKNANGNSSKRNTNDNANTTNRNANNANDNINGALDDEVLELDDMNTNAAVTNTNTNTVSATPGIISEVDPTSPYSSGIHHAIVTVDGYDPIEITLDADSAPISVTNFANLVEEGYYDGLTFYRFQDGFCMQGGTYGNSASGNDPSLDSVIGEFSTNGVSNPLADAFGRGVVAMARTTDPDSASSTFFVTLDDGPNVELALNGQYAAFGTIDDDGMAIVDKIVADHSANADPTMGMVNNEDDQARIQSIVMVD